MNVNVESLPNPNAYRWILFAAALSCGFQLAWFGTRCFHQIDIDGIDYIGIARHLRNHQFWAAINAFRSPLLSWLMAGGSIFINNFVVIGKVFSIGSYLVCAVLLYFLTKSLWHSELLAGVAVLWFSLARGLTATAVEMITPDFLFAALVLIYFLVLLQCLRADKKKYWAWLGAIHALAFLAKGFALPWLALTTFVSVLLLPPRKRAGVRLLLAGVLPLLVATAWAATLHSKYGAFTTGTQFKVNFLQWNTHAYDEHAAKTFALLEDTKPSIDDYHVNDPMPPGSWPWHYRIEVRTAAPQLLAREFQNLRKAAKELCIVVTPGGLVAVVFVVVNLAVRKKHYPVEYILAAVIVLGTISLLLAYCLLVFDGRYLYPIVPLLLAVAVGFSLQLRSPLWRRGLIALIVLGIFATLVYPSSPFRTITRDFQVSCYKAGQTLSAHPGSTVVSVGSGPYPEHGVGWEAAYKSTFFGDRRLIGATDTLPGAEEIPALLADVFKAKPDAILVWGRPGEVRYDALVRQFVQEYAADSPDIITDPFYGEVGTALYARQH
ncbi:MAG TPA: hypothetical protein VK828_21295 [Terriglobales bacterium]|nr:hypothetical protein [Terriglobales bacterium]